MALTDPIAWFAETLWRWREQERRTAADAPREAAAAEVDHELNTARWFLLPPV
jgi:hypothetical protein